MISLISIVFAQLLVGHNLFWIGSKGSGMFEVIRMCFSLVFDSGFILENWWVDLQSQWFFPQGFYLIGDLEFSTDIFGGGMDDYLRFFLFLFEFSWVQFFSYSWNSIYLFGHDLDALLLF